MFGALLEVELPKICTTPARANDLEVKIGKNWRSRGVFWGSKCVSRGRRRDFDTLQNTWQAQEFVRVAKTLAGVGDLKRVWNDAFRVAGAVISGFVSPVAQSPTSGGAVPAEIEPVLIMVSREGFLPWKSLRIGDNFDVVASLMVEHANTNAESLYRTMDKQGVIMRVQGVASHHPSCLFLGLQVVSLSPFVVCVGPSSIVLPVPNCTSSALTNVVELCCGIGGFSSVAEHVGLRTVAGVDQNGIWGPLFRSMHSSNPEFIQCDVGDQANLLPILSKLGLHFAVYLAGVNCQPFSALGDGLGMQDQRATSLGKSLKTAWLMQASVILLECVPQVMQNAAFQKELQVFCQATGYVLTQQVIALSNCWAARRDRWYGFLTAPALAPCQCDDIPFAPAFRTVGSVMPYVKSWPEEEQSQLELSLYELGKFYTYTPGGADTAFLKEDQLLPTCLHSAANALYACACGCRPALSEQRLTSKGLYGTLIPTGTSQRHMNQDMKHARYLHPKEMLLLNGADPTVDLGPNQRLALAGIGQFVSPLVGVWTLAHVSRLLSRFLGHAVPCDPQQKLLAFVEHLHAKAKLIWSAPPAPIVPVEPSVFEEESHGQWIHLGVHYFGDSAASCTIRINANAQVRDLCYAECELRHGQDDFEVRDSHGHVLQPKVFLAEIADVWLGPTDVSAADSAPAGIGRDPEVLPLAEQDSLTEVLPALVPTREVTDVSALASGSKDDLLTMVVPVISSLSALLQYRHKMVSKEVRRELLQTQQLIWADDEIAFGLQQIAHGASAEQNAVVCDPLLTTSAATNRSHGAFREFLMLQQPLTTVVTAFCFDAHWIPVIWRMESDQVRCYTAACPANAMQALTELHITATAIRTSCTEPICSRPVSVSQSCGAFAILFVQHLLWGADLPVCQTDVDAQALRLRDKFCQALTGVTMRPWIWGSGVKDAVSNTASQLEELLGAHGVPKDQVAARAAQLTSKLGTAVVIKALSCSQPWRELKWHASNHSPPIQIVLPSELQQVLDRKASQGQVGNRHQKKTKGKGKGQQGHTGVDPMLLKLEPGTFVTPSKEALPQLQLAQIDANANGVILVTASQAEPYLHSQKVISAGALAMVVLQPLPVHFQTPTATAVHFPAVCTSNSEPVLLQGLMFQLGAVPVAKVANAGGFLVQSIPSCVIKVMAYRDEVAADWKDFQAHPLRYILQSLPALQPCDIPDCTGHCEFWHAAEKCAIHDPVLEVWSRQWLLLSFAVTTPEQADIYSAHLRVPECLQLQLQAIAGTCGIYVEPKAIDGRQASDSFQVVWSPKSTLSQLQVLRRTVAGVCGIARLGSRYGLRCTTENASKVYQALKPGHVYLPPGPKMHWFVGPMPWGTIRSSVVEALRSIGWTARPLQTQPAGNNVAGVLFKVQSIEPPPKQTMSMAHGDVVITRADEAEPKPPLQTAVVGAPATVSMLKPAKQPLSEDLVWKHDPWAKPPVRVGNAAPTFAIGDPLADLESRVTEAVLRKIPAESMEVDGSALETRLTDLEGRLNQLGQSHQTLQTMVQEQSVEHTQQLQHMQCTFNQKQEQLELSINSNATQLQHEFQQQLQRQQSMLDGMFTKQMSQFESLLKKRGHQEWWCPVDLTPLRVNYGDSSEDLAGSEQKSGSQSGDFVFAFWCFSVFLLGCLCLRANLMEPHVLDRWCVPEGRLGSSLGIVVTMVWSLWFSLVLWLPPTHHPLWAQIRHSFDWAQVAACWVIQAVSFVDCSFLAKIRFRWGKPCQFETTPYNSQPIGFEHRMPRSRFWFVFVVMLTCCRVGEASHPGPIETWSFGIFNPSGLNTKLDHVAGLPGDVWIASETQLTQHGLRKFRQGLRALQSPLRNMVPGAPCPHRSDADAGTYSGVLLLSRGPSRALPHAFDPDMFATARMQVAGFLVGHLWVQVGYMYGYPSGVNHKYPASQSDGLLEALVDRIALQTVGPRLICGDLNHDFGELEQLDRLWSLGWRECQDIRALHWGHPVEATGRGKRRLDHIWVSPELLPFVQAVHLRRDMWADHASVEIQFGHHSLSRDIQTWFKPIAFPWPTDWQPHVSFDTHLDPSVAYASMWHAIEQQASHCIAVQGGVVLAKQCGRGATVSTHKRTLHVAPCKLGRLGEPQPEFFGLSLKHNRWFRQLRRLQHLACTLQKAELATATASASSAALICAKETWSAIRCAPGFGFGFVTWWDQMLLEPVFPEGLPFALPTAQDVQSMFHSFQAVVRKFEAQLAQSRYQGGKTRRRADLRMVYQDCKAEPAPQVDTLVLREHAVIEEIREHDLSVVLDRSPRFDPERPLVAHGQVLPLITFCHDQLWLSSLDHLQVGDTVCQEDVLASEADIADRFRKVWEPRWNKLQHLEEGQWTQILDFLDKKVPPLQWHFPAWTVDFFDLHLSKKKAKSAVGADGVSKQDLLSLPHGGKQAIVDMYIAIEQGSTWPLQLSTGVVTSLAKTPQAADVDSFRPITVYPILYRLWSSARARSTLEVLARVLPAGIQGCIPGRQAKAIWFEVAQLLEAAHWSGQALHGLILDVRKAFNALPRLPVWFFLRRLRFPPSILQAWMSFVAQQTRRFRVRHAVSDPIGSCVGFPEGCALSIVAMTLVDWALDMWLTEVDRSFRLLAYVDDWSITFEECVAFDTLWQAVQSFAVACDLELDVAKSCAWATKAQDRKALREGPLSVEHGVRLLGAHENFCLRSGNFTLVSRVKQMSLTWQRLRLSACPYRFKITSLLTLAWPRALHGISVVHLGSAHFSTLRAGAMRGLKADRIGSNASMHLACSNVLADPEAWAIFQTLRDARDFGGGDRLSTLLAMLCTEGHGLPRNGPTTVLSERLARLGWQVSPGGGCVDQIGHFDPITVGSSELLLRFVLAWPGVMSEAVQHRATFGGLYQADLLTVQKSLHTYGDSDQVFLRCHLDGTSYTYRNRAHWQPGITDACPFCEAPDGFYHRLWECDFFRECRTHMSSVDLASVPSLPLCLSCHAWAILPGSWISFLRLLAGLSNPFTPVVSCPLLSRTVVNLFVDGTCTTPSDPKLRLAAWAVTVAGDVDQAMNHEILRGGPLQGIIQTAFRAELQAVLEACKVALQLRARVRIWSDCLGVVRGVQKRLRGAVVTKPNAPNADLWFQLDALLQQLDVTRVQIVKVVSHGDRDRARDVGEDWAFWHNSLVDAAADKFNLERGTAFWAFYAEVEQKVLRHRKLHSDILQVHLKVGRLAEKTLNPDKEAKQQQRAADEGHQLPPMPAQWPYPDKLTKRYGKETIDRLYHWWMEVGDPAMRSNVETVWISGTQLLLDFMASTNVDGPVMYKTKWYAQASDRPVQEPITWPARTRAFLCLLRAFLCNFGVVLPNKAMRPRSAAISVWSVCWLLKWRRDRLEFIDDKLLTLFGRQAHVASDLLRVQPFLFPREWQLTTA